MNEIPYILFFFFHPVCKTQGAFLLTACLYPDWHISSADRHTWLIATVLDGAALTDLLVQPKKP